MAREAYRSLYGDLTKLKDDSVLKDPAAGADDDDELFQLLLAVSDWVDHYCNRHFYPRAETLLFDGPGGDRLLVPDLVAVSQLAQAEGEGRPFDKVWDPGDYRLLPHNASPMRHWGHPHGAVRACAGGNGFTAGTANFRVTGLWGYRRFVEPSGATLVGKLAADVATATVDDGGQLHIGQTVILGDASAGKGPASDEQALITGIDGNDLALSRGLNGTTAAEHASGTVLNVLRWPASVERAALIQSARIWTRAADFEPFYVDADVDTDVRLLLEPYRKPSGT